MSPAVLGVLGKLTDYRPRADVQSALGGAADLVDRLIDADLLLLEGSSQDESDRAVTTSWAWGHDARFFHFSTQASTFEDPAATAAALAELAARVPPPSPSKEDGDHSIALPRPEPPGTDLWRTLRARRTRRSFAGSLSLEQFSTLLAWTWGSSREMVDEVTGPYVLKTSPSGGARHPIEAYPLVLEVDGLDPGLYHYSHRRHALAPLRIGGFPELAVSLCAGQPWVASAGSLFLMTAVLERSMWKYRSSHAYRVVLLDAGHLGQTFHLVCTALGLAPFTSAAMDGRAIERELDVDGVREIAVYVAAAGVPI